MSYRIERNKFSPDKNLVVETRNFKGDFPSHTHEFFECSYVAGGEAIQIINGAEYRVKKGDLCILFPTDFHEIKSGTGMCSMYFSFTEEVMSSAILYDLIESKKESVYHLTENEQQRFESFFNLLSETVKENKKEKIVKNILECIVLDILEKMDTQAKIDKQNIPIYKAIMYIMRNFKSTISLEEISREAGLSKNYFSNIFNKNMGMSVSTYISNVRLLFAKNLLMSTDMTVTEICFESGFNSIAAFSKEYKKKYGISPKASRKTDIVK